MTYDTRETKGKHLVHNHPSDGWGNFSGTDLDTFAKTGQRAVSAVSRNEKASNNVSKKAYQNRKAGRYTIRKTKNFKSDEFRKAIRKISVKGDNYDRDLDRWLKKNAKKYGYEYTYRPAKNKVI